MLVPIGYNETGYECVDTSKPSSDNRCSVSKEVLKGQVLNNVEKKIMDIATRDLLLKGNCCRPLYTTVDLSFNKFGWGLKIEETGGYKTDRVAEHDILRTARMDTQYIDCNICHSLARVDFNKSLLFGGADRSTGFPFIVIGNIDGSLQLLPFTNDKMLDSSALHILMGVMRGQVSGSEFDRMKKKMDTTVYVSMTPSELADVEDKFINYMEHDTLLPCKDYDAVCTLMTVLLRLSTEEGQEWVKVMVYLLLCDSLHKQIKKLKWLSYTIDLELLDLKRNLSSNDCSELENGLALFGMQGLSRLVCDAKNNLVTVHLGKDDSKQLFETNHIAVIDLCKLSGLNTGSLVKSKSILYRLDMNLKMAKEPVGGYFESTDPLLINSSLNFVVEPDDNLDIILEMNKQYDLCNAGVSIYVDYDRWLGSGELDRLLYWIFDNAVKLTQYKRRSPHSSICINLVQCIPEVDGILRFKKVTEVVKHAMKFPSCMNFYEIKTYSQAVASDEAVKQTVRLKIVKAFVDTLELEKYNGSEYTTKVVLADKENNLHLYTEHMGKCDLALDCDVIMLKKYTENQTGFVLLFENHLYNMAGLIGRLNRFLEVVDKYNRISSADVSDIRSKALLRASNKGIQDDNSPVDYRGTHVDSCYTMLYDVVYQIVDKLIAEGLINYNEFECLDISRFSSKVADYVRAGHTAIKYKSPDFKWLKEYCDRLVREYCAELFN